MKIKRIEGIKNVWNNNWFIFKQALKIVPVYTLITCMIPASSQVLQFFEFQFMAKYMIDCIQYNRPFTDAAKYIIFVFILVTCWLFAVNYFKSFMLKKGQTKLHRYLQMEVYNKAKGMDLACYDDPEFYTDFVWATSEAAKRTDTVLETFANLVQGFTLILVSGVFMAFLDKAGILFVIASFVLTYIINLKINKLKFDLDTEMRPIQRKRDYIHRVFYLNDYSKEIRLNDIKGMLYKDFEKSNNKLTETIKSRTGKISLYRFLSGYLFNTLILNGIYVIYLLFRAYVIKVISYGSLAALLQSSWRLKRGLYELTRVLPQFQENSLYIERLRKFLSYESVVKNSENPISLPRELGLLELKNVCFSYHTGTPILKNINMKIQPREKIAIVGYNGAGKTTLINLILRLYEVDAGEILYAGHNIMSYDLTAYRDTYGAVFQDYQLFAASIAENVTMAHVDSEYIETDREAVEDSLNKSGLEDLLSTLPQGIDTPLTREFDDEGVNLSGGEAQKVAIARVLYKDCRMIVLDEASSALDPISGYNLNDTIIRASEERTVIFISHRLSTTRMADRIYMLEEGEIIEQGSHDDLMKLDGKYAYMFNLQAEKYRFSETLEEELCG